VNVYPRCACLCAAPNHSCLREPRALALAGRCPSQPRAHPELFNCGREGATAFRWMHDCGRMQPPTMPRASSGLARLPAASRLPRQPVACLVLLFTTVLELATATTAEAPAAGRAKPTPTPLHRLHFSLTPKPAESCSAGRHSEYASTQFFSQHRSVGEGEPSAEPLALALALALALVLAVVPALTPVLAPALAVEPTPTPLHRLHVALTP
jgi:hypothetical protein